MANNTLSTIGFSSLVQWDALGRKASWNIMSDEALTKTVKCEWKGYQVRDTIVGILITAESHAKKDNGIICYIRTSTFHARIEVTGNGAIVYILKEDQITPEKFWKN